MGNLAYQYELREEILNGKVIAMSPRATTNHNKIIANITTIFNNFLKGKPCISYCDGVDVHLTEKDIVIPDVMIICNKKIINKDGIYGAPDLVVEVLSPSTARNDKGYKKRLYEKCGVKEYWIVDEISCSIEVYTLQEGVFELDNVHSVFPDYVLKSMTQEEKSNIALEFKASIFPDLVISLSEVFDKLI